MFSSCLRIFLNYFRSLNINANFVTAINSNISAVNKFQRCCTFYLCLNESERTHYICPSCLLMCVCPNKVLSGSCFFPFPSVVKHNSSDDGKQKLRKNISWLLGWLSRRRDKWGKDLHFIFLSLFTVEDYIFVILKTAFLFPLFCRKRTLIVYCATGVFCGLLLQRSFKIFSFKNVFISCFSVLRKADKYVMI